jgi:short-subunit dehydrogenase
MIDVDGKVAVVTGASAGIGRRLAADLARDGAIVIGVARRQQLLDELATEMRAASPTSEGRACDVSDIDAYERLLQEVEDAHGRVDILVNNAGISDPEHTSAAEAGVELAQQLFATNVFAVIAGTKAVLPGMIARRFGVIVNVSSDSARAPEPGNAVYAASKAAVSAYTDSVAHEVAPLGVHVHVLFPGWVPTDVGLSGVAEHGLPPKSVRRTEEQVSLIVRRQMGGPVTEMSATRVAKLAVVGRTFFPRPYQAAIRRRSSGHSP